MPSNCPCPSRCASMYLILATDPWHHTITPHFQLVTYRLRIAWRVWEWRADAPARRSNASARRSNAPAQRADAPARRSNAPAQRSNAPARRSNAPAQRANAPAQRANAPARRSNAPARRADAPAWRANAPARTGKGRLDGGTRDILYDTHNRTNKF